MANALVDLVTLAQARAHAAATGASALPDSLLTELITRVSEQIQSYLSRNIVAQTYTATLNGAGSDRISLPNYPITAVSALSVDGVSKSQAPNATATGFVFSDTQVMLRGDRFTRGVQNVSITYIAGYNPIPADIQAACLEGIANAINALDYDPRATEVQAGGTKLVFGDIEQALAICLTANITTILNQLRRVVPC